MIKSYADKDTEALADGKRVRKWINLETVARRKLAMINAAATLEFLKSPPANHLEQLKGNRKGQYSIRINDQYRICFVWSEGHAFNVEIVDYH